MTKVKKTVKKAELIEVLVNEYGYEAEDLKFDANGKPFTNAALQSMINQEKLDAEELESQATKKTSKVTKIKDEDLISVMSGVGRFYYRSRQTSREWQFQGFGQEATMPFRELVTLRNSSPKVFEDGYIVILDSTVAEEFGLTEKYKNILTDKNVEEVFRKNVPELEQFIDALPQGMKVTFVDQARKMYESGRLDSIAKMEFIEKKFNFSFKDNAPLDDVV